MYKLLLASSLLTGAFGYQEVMWPGPEIVFGGGDSQSSVMLQNWETTVRLGQSAWSLSDAKMEHTAGADLTYGSPVSSNIVAERWPLLSP